MLVSPFIKSSRQFEQLREPTSKHITASRMSWLDELPLEAPLELEFRG